MNLTDNKGTIIYKNAKAKTRKDLLERAAKKLKKFNDLTLSGDYTNLNLYDTTFKNCKFSGKFDLASLRDCTFVDCRFEHIVLDNNYWLKCVFNSCSFLKVRATGICILDSEFDDCLMNLSSILDSKLEAIKMDNSYLKDVLFYSNYLAFSSLDNSSISSSNFSNNILESTAVFNQLNNAGELLNDHSILPAGDIIGYKKCRDGVIAKLLIPAGSKRTNGLGRKCRAEYVRTLEFLDSRNKTIRSNTRLYDPVVYKVGVITRCHYFDTDLFRQCGGGIHFFITEHEARAY